MATRSTISLHRREKGKIATIYCHWDGYIKSGNCDGVGETLKKHYNTIEKVEALISLGNLSALYENIAPAEGVVHNFDKPCENVTIAYIRDRGDEMEDEKAIESNSFDECRKEEYNYLFADGKWMVQEEGELENF